MKKFFALFLSFLFVGIFALNGAAFAADAADAAASPDKIAKIVEFLMKLPELIGLVVSALMAIIAVCLVIPGDQPEKFLLKVVDILSKFSKKPADKQ